VSAPWRSRFAWSIAVGSLILTLVSGIVAIALDWSTGDWLLTISVILATVAFGAIGALIASRTGNLIGWALLAVIGMLSVSLSTQTYATYAILEAGGAWPLAIPAAWVATVTFMPSLALIVAIPLLYPTGTPRWRWIWWVYLGAVAVLGTAWAVLPQELSLAVGSDVVAQPQNPYEIRSMESQIGTAVGVAATTILACAALSIVALILRSREATGEARQQIRWLAYVGVAAVVAFVANIVGFAVLGDPPAPGIPAVVSNILFQTFVWIVVFGIPAACGVAILKYHLYDLDVVIRKTVIFTLVAVTLVALYLAVLALATVGNAPRLIMGMILLIVTFRPVQRAARAIADRVAYGKRASAYEVLTAFSGRVGETYATEDVLPRMARILAEGTGASAARVFLRLGPERRPVALWPPDATPGDDEHVVPVMHRGEELGALGVTMPSNDAWDASRERLSGDLASQAGLVLRNVKLIEELRASRQRLVAAQDEERRKIERNLHDGVQQQLVAMNVQLGLLARVAEADPAKAVDMAAMLQTRAIEALDDLRDLARGIYPPLLADKGLVAALEAQARKAAVPTTVRSEQIERYPQEVESAVYFCVLEALNNVAKYAAASQALIELTQQDGYLRFVVRDDGAGFDASAAGYGTGLQGMADRLDAIGGELKITSESREGTTITGSIPTQEAS